MKRKWRKSIRKFDREYAELTAKQVKAYYLQKAQLQKDVQLTLTYSIKEECQSEHTIDLCDGYLQITDMVCTMAKIYHTKCI